MLVWVTQGPEPAHIQGTVGREGLSPYRGLCSGVKLPLPDSLGAGLWLLLLP